MLVPFLLRPSRDGVTLTDDEFVATFGLVKISTPRANITGAHITRNYRWWTACGVRMSFADAAKRPFGAHRHCRRFGGARNGPGPTRRSGCRGVTPMTRATCAAQDLP